MQLEQAFFILRHGSAEGKDKYFEAIENEFKRQKAEIERLQKDLDIINAANTELYGAFEENERLKSEIERLQKECEITRAYIHNNGLEWGLVSHLEFYKNQRAEAIKEFAERLKKNPLRFRVDHITHYNKQPISKMVLFLDDTDIDNLVKEMEQET